MPDEIQAHLLNIISPAVGRRRNKTATDRWLVARAAIPQASSRAASIA
jgi:hypothetical protein